MCAARYFTQGMSHPLSCLPKLQIKLHGYEGTPIDALYRDEVRALRGGGRQRWEGFSAMQSTVLHSSAFLNRFRSPPCPPSPLSSSPSPLNFHSLRLLVRSSPAGSGLHARRAPAGHAGDARPQLAVLLRRCVLSYSACACTHALCVCVSVSVQARACARKCVWFFWCIIICFSQHARARFCACACRCVLGRMHAHGRVFVHTYVLMRVHAWDCVCF